ncbi:MAG: type II toxin-antitoxin system PemK/MazF family toxin [Bacteroidales bacterium]|nr:type II toxin-antitoxin system PemK/MazF family toxin [Bacteroidales bacterium]
MKVGQGDIIEINFYLPGKRFEPHPCIVVSNNDVNEYEDSFVVAMLSTTKTNDNYSYHLEDYMVTKKPRNKGQVRCHLISLAPDNAVLGRYGRIKKKYLIEVIEKIKSDVLNVT